MKRYITLIIGAVLIVAAACDTDLDKVNPNNPTVESFYANADELLQGVNGAYALLASTQLMAREYWFLHDLRSDDMVSGGGQLETPRNQLLIGTNAPDNSVAASVWDGLYRLILRANTVIEKAPEVVEIEESFRNRIIGEAQFLRGWAYYELAILWGGAPLYESVPTSTADSKERSSESEVIAKSIEYLEAAVDALPASYDGDDLGRATQGAALAILARMQMHNGDYSGARTSLQRIVDSGEYGLVDNYFDNFTEEGEYNNELIWEIGFADIGGFNWAGDGNGLGNEESVRTQEYSAIGWRNLIPSPTLLNAYERPELGDAKRDPRLDDNFYFIGDLFNNNQDTLFDENVQGNTVVFDGVEQKISWRKYSLMYKMNPGGFATGGINHNMMRYAEVLLSLAECENELNNGPEAVALVNQVRARSSVDMPALPTTNIPTGNQTEIFEAIAHERQVELCSEQVRGRDILRWRRNGKLDEEPLGYFTSNRHELLPLPQAEIANNPNISQDDQNPGY